MFLKLKQTLKIMKCKICKNSTSLKEYIAREMMFGLKEEFIYFQCGDCNCLQIVDIPTDMQKYYPSNYYSYAPPSFNATSGIMELLKQNRNSYAVFNKGVLGKLIYKRFPNVEFRSLSEVPLTKDTKILDVGCGSGRFLIELQKIGFKNLLGVDPYLDKDIEYGNGLKIYKKSIHDVEEKKDIIMFHHSFEHLSDPLETLQSVSKLLNNGGYCIIRVPTTSSYAWKHYKENWVQFDAPRHFFIHSKESISFLAEKTSLSLEKIVYDSTGFQFWGSEQYLQDIPLRDAKSYANNPEESIFSDSEIKAFEAKAKELNDKGEGDMCAFFLKKI